MGESDRRKKILPYLESILDSGIDEYAAFIKEANRMDTMHWKYADDYMDAHYYYRDFNNSVRYLKFFLAKRLNYLCERLQVPHEKFTVNGNGEAHEVTFLCDDKVIEMRHVADGDTLMETSYLDDEKYEGWFYKYNDKEYSNLLPVYEDCVLYAKCKSQ